MPKKSTKSRSKRVSLHQKYKVIKKVKEHHRKKAKELRKKGHRAKAPKDPGIPNSWPFKEQLVKELEFERERVEAAKAARREAAKERRAERRRAGAGEDEDDSMGEPEEAQLDGGVGQLAARAAAAGHDFDTAGGARASRDASGLAPAADADRSRRAFYKEFVKVVDAADVIIQVLDARDPLACRAPEVERFVRSRGPEKKLVLCLNKIDLVPRHAAEAWLAYFRDELPTVAFKCATGPSGASARRQQSRTGVSAAGSGGGECVGADMLVGLLKNYARSRSLKTAVTVGIVGLPNVGKSSLINSLCRTRAAASGATPGLTRSAQEIVLDKHVKLLDSPGIVFATASPGADAAAALRNAIRVEKLEDPVPPVEEILRRSKPDTLQALYAIPRFGDVTDFLRLVAAKRGKLKKGGVPETPAAARLVLGDWNAGRIPFFTMPPARGDARHETVSVVSSFAADFDVSALNSAVLVADAADADGEEFMELEGDAPRVTPAWGGGDEGEGGAPGDAMDEGETRPGAKPSKAVLDGKHQNQALLNEEGMFNHRLAKAQKKAAKKGTLAVQRPRPGQEDEFDWEATTADARRQAALRRAAEEEGEPGSDMDDEE